MQDGKDLFASKATWGVLIPVLYQLLKPFGIEIPGDVDGIAEAVSVAVGAVLFVIGQLMRKKPITSVAGISVEIGGKGGGTTPMLLLALLLAAPLVLPGCALVADMTAPAKPVAERAIDAKLLLAAQAQTIAADVKAGVLTADEAQASLDRVSAARATLARAEALLGAGKLNEAATQVRLAELAVTELRAYLARKERGHGS